MSYDPNQLPDFSGAVVTPPSPSLSEALRQLPGQYWRAISQPHASTYVAEQNKATWQMVWVQLLIAAVLSLIILLLSFYLIAPGAMQQSITLNPALANNPEGLLIAQRIAAFYQTFAIPLALLYIILGGLAFFVIVYFMQLITKGFGGQGTFLQYTYCTLLIGIPLGIISGLISLLSYGITGSAMMTLTPISIVIGVIGLALSIYHLVLQILMTTGVYRLSGGRASAGVLLGLLVGFILIVIGAIIIGFIIGLVMVPFILPR